MYLMKLSCIVYFITIVRQKNLSETEQRKFTFSMFYIITYHI